MTDYHDFTWPSMPVAKRKKLNVGPLYINGAVCTKEGGCGWFVRSRNRHDMRSCRCGAVAVDGGSCYGRLLGDPKNYEVVQVTFKLLSADEK